MKFKYSPELEALTYGRPLPLGLRYPCEWGFVAGTRAADGDPLDALIISDAATFPGVIVSCRLLGIIDVEQDDRQHGGRQRNDRIVAVPLADARAEHLQHHGDIPARIRAELEAFLLATVQFEGKHVTIIGWRDAAAAHAAVERAATT